MTLVYELIFLSNSEERDDTPLKWWYWQYILLESFPVELQANSRISNTPDCDLVLHNVTPGGAGFYFCLKYTFLLDGKPNFSQTLHYSLNWLGSWVIFQNQSNVRVIIDMQWSFQHMKSVFASLFDRKWLLLKPDV